ncbi:DUF4147 domain-containing protein, partial [bacterium]|nr:DUF4147 domain-containing protein [bacterium]
CLLSGGGSALLPAPADGITLADKLAVTRLLHRSGATIDEMNCVRKHLSRVKGGRLAAAFHGKLFVTLIVSDVVGDPLDVIASGPTAPDPTTFADATAVLARYGLIERVPASVNALLARGESETLKELPPHVMNHVIGSNRLALDAAARIAEARGYRVLDLGAFVEGETAAVATAVAGVVRSIRRDAKPLPPPACVLIGGETTVTLGETPGRGGRNQEFVLALMQKLAATPGGLAGVTVLSGGTDGEDGPTDAAGAVADADTPTRAAALGLGAADALRRHDAYPFFAATGDLLTPGLTGTNVMDVRLRRSLLDPQRHDLAVADRAAGRGERRRARQELVAEVADGDRDVHRRVRRDTVGAVVHHHRDLDRVLVHHPHRPLRRRRGRGPAGHRVRDAGDGAARPAGRRAQRGGLQVVPHVGQ